MYENSPTTAPVCGAVCRAKIEGVRFRHLLKNATQAECRNTMQKKKEVAKRGKEPFGSIPGGVYSVEVEKVSVDSFVLVRFKILVLAVDFNHTFKQAAVFDEKPCCFNCARPRRRKGELSEAEGS